MSSKKSLIILLLTYFGLILLVYIHNLSRSVYGGDVGDMISASSVFGVAHPPGYPLFTFIGFLLTRIHLMTPAFMVGLISAFSSAASVVVFFLISLKLTKNRAISLISSLVLAFNYLFWFYAEIAEVFALNSLFTLLLFYIALLYREKKDKKYLFALALIAGLSLTNHQTIVLVFPSILILIYQNLLKLFKTPKILFTSILIFIAGISFYAYIPLAASHNPPINWDHVKDLDSFLRLILRKDYGTFSAGAFEAANFAQRIIIAKTYLADLTAQLTIPVVVLGFFGLFYNFSKDKKLFFSILTGFLISGPLFVSYAGFPLLNSFFVGVYERFFIISSLVFLLLFPTGLLFFVKIINKILKKDLYQPLFLAVFFLIPLSLFYYNFPKTDLSNVYIGDRLAYDFVAPLPKNSVLLLAGDTVLFNVSYLHYSLNFRPDVQTVNINGLSGDSFYDKFETKYLYINPKDKKDVNLRTKVIAFMAKERPVFSYDPLQPSKGEKYLWVPYGLTFKLISDKSQAPTEDNFLKETDKVWASFKKPSLKEVKSLALGSLTIADLPSIYADALLETGNFLLSEYKDKTLAFKFFKKALNTDLNYHKTYEVLGIYYLSQKECGNAKDSLNKAISIYPFEKISYYLLYLTYSDCLHDKNMQQKTVADYKNILKGDLLKDYKISK